MLNHLYSAESSDEARVKPLEAPYSVQGHSAVKRCCAAGDTLFALGCGRLFEGNAKQMWASLSKMLPLPRSATVFCAHEYTQVAACSSLSPSEVQKCRGKGPCGHCLQWCEPAEIWNLRQRCYQGYCRGDAEKRQLIKARACPAEQRQVCSGPGQEQ